MEFSNGLRSIMVCPAEHEYGVKLKTVVERMGLRKPCVPPEGKENCFCDPRKLDPNLTPQQRKELSCEVRTGILTLLAQGRTTKEDAPLRSRAANQKMSIPARLAILAAIIAFWWLIYALGN